MATVLEHTFPIYSNHTLSDEPPYPSDELPELPHPSSDDSNDVSCTSGYWRSPENIETWVADVQEAVSLPPLVMASTPECQCPPCCEDCYPRNTFFKISSPIPWDTFQSIRHYIVDSRNPVTLLKQLPDPETRPLVSSARLLCLYYSSQGF